MSAQFPGTALGILELSSISRGVFVVDTMAKRAPVSILQNHPSSPGKHLIVISGGVAEVEESMAAGVAAARTSLVDRLFLPQAHPTLAPLVAGETISPRPSLDAVGIVETQTACAAVLGADASAKAAQVTLLDMRLCLGIGGKGYFTMTGPLEDIEAALVSAQGVVESGLIVGTEVIANPHEDLHRRLFW
ncbi:MAG: BMC domain-containing protein [Deltaproteobacteria bacterium]|nr:BMC domain-containing protein [Deltaproteobacteria bacterium]